MKIISRHITHEHIGYQRQEDGSLLSVCRSEVVYMDGSPGTIYGVNRGGSIAWQEGCPRVDVEGDETTSLTQARSALQERIYDLEQGQQYQEAERLRGILRGGDAAILTWAKAVARPMPDRRDVMREIYKGSLTIHYPARPEW